MHYKRRIKKKPLIILTILIVIIALICVYLFNIYKYYNSPEYKLGKAGYSEKEINEILKMDDKYIKYAMDNKYEDDFIALVNEKYFLWKNYDAYIKYIDDVYGDKKVDYSYVVSMVNTRNNYDYYTHTVSTNMNAGNGILVNKYYKLPDKYAPKDIVPMSNLYAYPGNSINKEVYEAFKEMAVAANKENIVLIVNSSYRDYKSQKKIYENYKEKNGQAYADQFAARPDFSEHQTGLALDIFTPGAGMTTFENTKAFKWLKENSYKYGFILRYPEGKEKLTGYSYEPWHYRYLGKDLAKKVYDSGLTFDEYYTYYLEK